MISGAPAIRVEGLVKRYPLSSGFRDLVRRPFARERRTALDGVTLDVEHGSCFCLLGPNGAGKTTLIKILTTLILPDGGRAFVDGVDVEKAPERVKRSIGFAINDERGFYWRLSGRQNLEFFGVLNAIRGEKLQRKILEVLRITGLEAAAGRRFNTYSTGMRQMLAFARALLTDPKILFVDEPTRSLDPIAAERVRVFLRDELVGRQGRTVFWATHNLAEAEAVAEEIAVLDRGRVKVHGPLAQLTEAGRIPLQRIYGESLDMSSGDSPGSEGRTAT